MATRKRLDQILQTQGLVTETKIRGALNRQRMLGGKLGEHLLRAGDIREIELVGALSEQFGVPGVCLAGRQLDPALFDILPRTLAEAHLCVPLTYDGVSDTLDIAFADPGNADALRAICEAVHPARVRALVAAETSIHAVLAQAQQSATAIPIAPTSPEGSGPSPSDPVMSSFILLLELAVRAIERGGKTWPCDSVWTARLAEEMAMRLGLSNGIAQTVRLTALTASSAAWQRPAAAGEPLATMLERSRSLLGTMDLPWDLAGLLAESIHWNDINAPSPAAQVLRTSFAAGELKPDSLSEETIKVWREKVTNSVKWNLAPELTSIAFAIVEEWWQRHQLGEPPSEVMIVGASALADALADRLAAAKYRHLTVSSVSEAILLIRRRTPDLVCVHAAAENGFTHDELADVLGAIPRHSSHVLLVVHDKCGARMMDLAREGLAEVIAETDGPDSIVARIQSALTPQHQGEARLEGQGSSSRAKSSGFPSVAGHLADMSLADLVQVLAAAHKTAKVLFRRPGHDAILWFHHGQIVSALSGGLTGENAFFDLVGWRDGTFEVHTTEETPARNVLSSTPALLLEGYRRLDEARRDSDVIQAG